MLDPEMDRLQAAHPELREARLFAKLAMFKGDVEHLGYDIRLSAHDDDDPPRMQIDITRRPRTDATA